MPMDNIGKSLILMGIVVILVGIFLAYGNKIPFLGKLPGDVAIKRENFSFYFPITTSIVLSAIASLILWIISKRSP